MMLVFSRSAINDLEAIGDRIALDNPQRAATSVSELRAKARGLRTQPRRFPLVEGFEQFGFRKRVHGNYLILYRILDDRASITRILHAARDIDAILGRETGM